MFTMNGMLSITSQNSPLFSVSNVDLNVGTQLISDKPEVCLEFVKGCASSMLLKPSVLTSLAAHRAKGKCQKNRKFLKLHNQTFGLSG